MSGPIRLIIKGSVEGGTDAPTVEDLLGQVRDFVDILRGVEKALEPDGNKIVWRVTNVTQNSPITFELSPYAVDQAAYVGARAERVERAAGDGLAALQAGVERPAYFTDDVLPKARKLYARVTNGLADTRIEFPVTGPVEITPIAAREVERIAKAKASSASVAYREVGSLEGFFAKAELDGSGRPVLWFRHRLDNVLVKAIGTGDAFRQIERFRLGEVWGGARIRVYGTISYKDLGVVEGLTATGIEVLDQETLPGLDDIIDPYFTGGMSTEAFLEGVRNG